MAKKKKSGGRSKPSSGRKFGATVKKWGWFKGPGKYVRSQTGFKWTEKAVPAALMLVAVAAITPPLGAQLATSVRSIPIVAPLAATFVGYGTQIRRRAGMR